MSLLSKLVEILGILNIEVETGIFSGVPPDEYAVITPLSDTFELFADNLPKSEIQEARISLFTEGNYTALKNSVVSALLTAGLTVTERRYIGHEDDTGYHHYAIDAANNFNLED